MLQKIQKSIFTKPIIVVLIIALINLSFIAPNGTVTLKAGTPISLELATFINTLTIQTGQSVDFKVKSDIKVDDKVVIPAGSIAKGQVIRADKAKAVGKPGAITIEIRSVTAVDGQIVPLSGGNIYREGEDKQALSIVLGVLICLLCLLIKGKEVVILPGTSFDTNVAANIDIQI